MLYIHGCPDLDLNPTKMWRTALPPMATYAYGESAPASGRRTSLEQSIGSNYRPRPNSPPLFFH